MKKHGKKFVEALEKVDKTKTYNAKDAIKLVKETTITKFYGTVELVFNLNINPKKSDQQIRGSLVLPEGSGRTQKVLAIVKEDLVKGLQEVGADHVGGVELLEKIKNENWFDFDIIVTTPDMMPEVGKVGTILGPKGLMPNPRTGTISPNPEEVVKNIKSGMVTYKNDPHGNVHTIIGKASFDDKKLLNNLNYVVEQISKQKPSTIKGHFIKTMTLTSTMAPGIRLDKNSFDI